MKLKDVLVVSQGRAPRAPELPLATVSTAMFGNVPYIFLQGQHLWPASSLVAYDGMGITSRRGTPRPGVIMILMQLRDNKTLKYSKLDYNAQEVVDLIKSIDLVSVENDVIKMTKAGRQYLDNFAGDIDWAHISSMWATGRDILWR